MNMVKHHRFHLMSGLILWSALSGCAVLSPEPTAAAADQNAAGPVADRCGAEAEAFRDGDYRKLSQRFTAEFAERLNAERFEALQQELARQGKITEIRFLDTMNRKVYATAVWKITLKNPESGEIMERLLEIMVGNADGAPRVIALSVQ